MTALYLTGLKKNSVCSCPHTLSSICKEILNGEYDYSHLRPAQLRILAYNIWILSSSYLQNMAYSTNRSNNLDCSCTNVIYAFVMYKYQNWAATVVTSHYPLGCGHTASHRYIVGQQSFACDIVFKIVWTLDAVYTLPRRTGHLVVVYHRH